MSGFVLTWISCLGFERARGEEACRRKNVVENSWDIGISGQKGCFEARPA